MAGASVKSFLIADLLVGKEKLEEKSETERGNVLAKKCKIDDHGNRRSEKAESGSSRGSTPGGGNVDSRVGMESIRLAPEDSSSSSTSDEDKEDKSPKYKGRSSEGLKYEVGNVPGGSFYQYHGFPMGFPLPGVQINAAAAANNMTDTGSALRNFSSFYPYGFDSFRHNRNLFGRHHNAAINSMMLPSVSGIPHGGNFSQGMEYPMYPSFHGLYGLPLSSSVATGLHDKGSLMGDRDSYPLLHLGRPMYTVNCKRKGGQIRFTNSQTAQLEKAFVQQKYLNANDRKKLAHSLNLSDRQVKTWFQNRRAKLRKCKGGLCTESEDSRTVSPHSDNIHCDTRPGAKNVSH